MQKVATKQQRLAKKLSKTLTSEYTSHILELRERNFTSTVNYIQVTPEKVLDNLKTTKSPRIDTIHHCSSKSEVKNIM